MKKKFSIKNMNPFFAMIGAILSDFSVLYFGKKIIPIFLNVADLINAGTKIDL
ncbi:hypothetical protein [Desulfobacter vibrioformis]|uniref:hypothetical protein n=1 Tax=Desulfobacter vibrioformis TaxID=34031 RepID=UPI0012EBDAD9|nr:hypothetical protein [Desulfobacter vibrioformis]